jgi:hypothetical protein
MLTLLCILGVLLLASLVILYLLGDNSFTGYLLRQAVRNARLKMRRR